MLPATVQAADAQPVGLLGVGHRLDAGDSGNHRVGTTDLNIGRIPSGCGTGDRGKGPRGDTGHGLVVVQCIEVVVTIGAIVAIACKLIIEIVGKQLDVGLTGKIISLSKLIIGLGVKYIIARCERQQNNAHTSQYN